MIEHKPERKTVIKDGKKKVGFLCSHCDRAFSSKRNVAIHLGWVNRREKKAARVRDTEDKNKGTVVKKGDAVGHIVDQVEKAPLQIQFADNKKQGDKEQPKNGKTLEAKNKKLKSKGFGWLGICVLLGIIALIAVFTIKKTKKSKENLSPGDENVKGERRDNGGSAKEPGREWIK